MFCFISKTYNKLRELCPKRAKPLNFPDEAAVVTAGEIGQKIYIMYKDDVYDVTDYLEKHPGGKQILLVAKGKIVDKVFEKYHYPLGNAFKIMKKYKIGSIKREVEGSLRSDITDNML